MLMATWALKAPENFLLLAFMFHCKIKLLFQLNQWSEFWGVLCKCEIFWNGVLWKTILLHWLIFNLILIPYTILKIFTFLSLITNLLLDMRNSWQLLSARLLIIKDFYFNDVNKFGCMPFEKKGAEIPLSIKFGKLLEKALKFLQRFHCFFQCKNLIGVLDFPSPKDQKFFKQMNQKLTKHLSFWCRWFFVRMVLLSFIRLSCIVWIVPQIK